MNPLVESWWSRPWAKRVLPWHVKSKWCARFHPPCTNPKKDPQSWSSIEMIEHVNDMTWAPKTKPLTLNTLKLNSSKAKPYFLSVQMTVPQTVRQLLVGNPKPGTCSIWGPQGPLATKAQTNESSVPRASLAPWAKLMIWSYSEDAVGQATVYPLKCSIIAYLQQKISLVLTFAIGIAWHECVPPFHDSCTHLRWFDNPKNGGTKEHRPIHDRCRRTERTTSPSQLSFSVSLQSVHMSPECIVLWWGVVQWKRNAGLRRERILFLCYL